MSPNPEPSPVLCDLRAFYMHVPSSKEGCRHKRRGCESCFNCVEAQLFPTCNMTEGLSLFLIFLFLVNRTHKSRCEAKLSASAKFCHRKRAVPNNSIIKLW